MSCNHRRKSRHSLGCGLWAATDARGLRLIRIQSGPHSRIVSLLEACAITFTRKCMPVPLRGAGSHRHDSVQVGTSIPAGSSIEKKKGEIRKDVRGRIQGN